MNLEKLKDTARKYEQKEDWRRAIDVYLKAIHDYEAGKDPHPDLSLYNRVGDLHMKVNDTAAAVRSYERAADLYTEQGFLNNAIALCGKILRVNPGRTQIYFKLAQIHARKNMVVDAKRHLIDYIERMNRAGQLDEAFQAVTIFADQFQQNQEIRLMLIDLLRAASRDEQALVQLEKLATELESRGDQVGARKTRERIEELESGQPEAAAEAIDATEMPAVPVVPGLVFLDVGSAPPRTTPPPAPAAVEAEAEAEVTVETPVTPPAELTFLEMPELDEAALEEEEVADVDAPVEVSASMPDALLRGDIELTLVGEAGSADIPPLDGLEREEPPAAASLQADDIDLMLEPAFESTDPVESRPLEGLELVSADIDAAPVDGFESAQQLAGIDDDEDVVEVEVSAEAYVHDEFSVDELATADAAGDDQAPPGAPLDLADDEWVADDWSSDATAEAEPEVVLDALEPLAAADAAPAGETGAPTIAELEEAVLDDPEDPRRHQALAEALLLQGETARAVDEFELALSGFELGGDEPAAEALVDVLVTLQPDEVRFFQRRVEYAYRAGDRDRLLGAYLDLGDALARLQMNDKASAVFWRVLEHEPDNVRSRLALQAMGELEADADVPPLPEVQVIEAPSYAEEAEPAAPAPVDEAAAPEPVPESAPPEPVVAAPRVEPDDVGFVDLGALVIDGDGRPRDTRMTGVQLEPTGDEQQDFAEMLAQFKKGIEENVDLEDYEAHYDLGIAFKEMGLLDEAVAEFQKALRAPEGRLRTSEALGVSFYEKGQHAVAEAVLRRAVEALPGADDEKIGLIYWLGRACEQQGKVPEARAMYERAVAVDIRFMDTSERIHRLTTGRP